MGRYALLFAGIHLLSVFVLGIFIQAFAPHPGSGLGFVVIVLVGYAVSWFFARKRQRRFTKQEKWRLIWLCYTYLVLFETFSIWAALSVQPTRLPWGYWVGVVVFTAGMDWLALWLAYTRTVRAMFDKKFGPASPSI
jgi:hypothetical protein